MPNERWQADITHWALEDGTDVEIFNVLDDHSRFLVGSDALVVFKAADVVASFHVATAAHGLPARCSRTTARVHRGSPGWRQVRDRGGSRQAGGSGCTTPPLTTRSLRQGGAIPSDAQRWLRRQPRASRIAELQAQLDAFRAYYNEVRRSPGDRQAHAGRGVRGASESMSSASRCTAG